MGPATKDRILRAADRAPSVYPGPVGELLRQELRSWLVFGRFLGSDLIVRAAGEDRFPEPAAEQWPERPGYTAVRTPVPRGPGPDEARDLAAAADRAREAYPGPVGELVHREIRAYLDFGHRFGNDTALVERLVKDLLAATAPAPVRHLDVPGRPARVDDDTGSAGGGRGVDACAHANRTRSDTSSGTGSGSGTRCSGRASRRSSC